MLMIYEKIRGYLIIALIIIIITLFFFTVYYRYNYINTNLQLDNSLQENKILLSEISKQNKNITDYKKEIENQVILISEINRKSSAYQKYIDDLRIELKNKDIQKEIKEDPIKANSEINKSLNLQFKNIMDLTK